MVMLDILQGVRPKRPIFATTRGYTKELWQVTVCCWEEDPSSRPTVDHVLDALRSVAEQRESKHKEIADPSPWDDWSPTLMEDSDPPAVPENENEPTTKSSQQFVIESPAPFIPTPIPSFLAPSGAEDGSSPKPAPAASKDVKPVPIPPPKRGEERKPAPATSKREGTKEEEPLRPAWKKGDIGPAPPALHLSGSIPQITPSTKLNTSASPRLTPDEAVDRVLDRAKLPMEDVEVRKVIEVVEKVSGTRLLPMFR